MIRISALLFRGVLWVLIVLSTLYGLAILLQIFLICHPVEAAYNTTINGKCGNQKAAFLSIEIFGLILDLAIVILPFPRTLSLDMPPRRKLVVLVILSVGAV